MRALAGAAALRNSVALPKSAALFEALPWAELPADAAAGALELFCDAVSSSERALPVWSALAKRRARLRSALLAAPATHRNKLLHIVRSWFWNSGQREAELLDDVLLLAERLAVPALLEGNFASYALEGFVRTPGRLAQVLSMKDETLLEFERACRQQSSAGFIGDAGLDAVPLLGSHASSLFRDAPGKFARTLRSLGMLAKENRRELLSRAVAEPLFTRSIAELPWHGLVDLFESLEQPGLSNPIPRKLRPREGRLAPSPAQEARVRRMVEERLSSIRLDLLRARCLQLLRRGLPANPFDPAERHALELASTIEHNRRGLRRFLTRHFAGDPSWLATHPETERWFRQHPKVDRAKWTEGVEARFEVRPFGEVVLRFERDPLEILRLGTNVGSCLSVGGLCDYSAAAVLLDANKQVVYARDAHGAVVARQVVAVSDDDRLICFLVYPEAAARALRPVFREYDLLLARTLGLEIALDESKLTVENVLSEVFWFDHVWDLEPGAEERRTRSG